MPNPDEITSELPAPRDDEPRELRKDIADELADHLHCAVQREQFQGDRPEISEQSARAAAIERFGDPAAVARRLWWDAMKEKIMTQRILSVLVVAAVAMSVVSCVLMWQMLRSGREAQAALLESNREALAALVAKIDAFRDNAPGKPDDWQSVRVKFVDESGKPATATANCWGTPFDSKERISASATAGADGVADLGRLPTGKYQLEIRTELTGETTSVGFLLGPGRPFEQTIECPTSVPRPVAIHIDVVPPENLQAKPLYYTAELNFQGRTVAAHRWNTHVAASWFLLDRTGKVLGELPPSMTRSDVFEPGPFPTHIPAGVDLQKPSELTPGKYLLRLRAYVTEGGAVDLNQQTGSGTQLPELHLVGDFTEEVELKPDGSPIYRLAPSQTKFWQPILQRQTSELPARQQLVPK